MGDNTLKSRIDILIYVYSQDSFITRRETRLLKNPIVPLTPTFAVYAALWLGRQPIHCLL